MRKYLSLMLLVWGVFVFSPQPTPSQVLGGPKPLPVEVKDFPRNSVILFWAPVKGADHYEVDWIANEDSADIGSAEVLPYSDQGVYQAQPLRPERTYTFNVRAVNSEGQVIAATVLKNVKPKGLYEAGIYKAIKDAGGAYYDPNADAPHLVPSTEWWHTQMRMDSRGNHQWEPYVNSEGIYLWGHNGFFINHQIPGHHLHMSATDKGGGVVSGRLEAPIDLSILKERPIRGGIDTDKGPTGRQAFYLILTSTKFGFPDVTPQNEGVAFDPNLEIRLRGTSMGWPYNGPVITMDVFTKGKKASATLIASRGGSWANVRQIVEFAIHSDRVDLLIDRNYDGIAEVVGSIPVDTSSWEGFLYPYLTIGSYNQAKINNIYGHPSPDVFLDPLRAAFDSKVGDPNWNAKVDYNKDGVIDVFDLDLLTQMPLKKIRQYFCMLWHMDKVWHTGVREVKTNAVCNCGNTSDKPCPKELMKHTMEVVTNPFQRMPDMTLMKRWTIPMALINYANWKPGKPLPEELKVRLYADAMDSVRFSGSPVFLREVELKLIHAGTKKARTLWSKKFPGKGRAVFNVRSINFTSTPHSLGREGDVTLNTKEWGAGPFHLQFVATTVYGGKTVTYSGDAYLSPEPIPLTPVTAGN